MLEQLRNAVEQIETAANPVDVARDLVVESNGYWFADTPTEGRGLIEFQLLGVHSVGLSAAGAIQSWLTRARNLLDKTEAVDTAA